MEVSGDLDTPTPLESTGNHKLSYGDFVDTVAKRIHTIVDTGVEEGFFTEQKTLFGFSDTEDISDESEGIENNFLYNIPNIICYLYSELGVSTKPIIIALGRMYYKLTGEKLFGIDWYQDMKLPRKKIEALSGQKQLGEKYAIYLFGGNYFSKNKSSTKKGSKERTHRSPAQLIKKSSLYRRKVLQNLGLIHEIEKGEFIRVLVTKLLEKLHDIETVSDAEFVEYLITECRKDIQERERKKESKPQEGANEEKEDSVDGEDVGNKEHKKDPEVFLKELEVRKERGLSDERKMLVQREKQHEYKKRLHQAQDVSDAVEEAMIEREIAHYVLSQTLRYKKNKTEDYNDSGIPQHFMSSEEYTCFSGTWLMSSVLPEYGLDPERLFFADSIEGTGAIAYKHAYLVYKLANGGYIKIDYGFSRVFDARSNFDSQIEGLEYGLNKVTYSTEISDNDFSGYLYRLKDGLGLIYLVSLMGRAFQDEEYQKVFEIAAIARTYDNDSYHIYELEGLVYEKLGETEKAVSAFQKCIGINDVCPSAHFKLGEYFYKTGNYRQAEIKLKRFLKIAKTAWNIDPMYIQKANGYMDAMKARFSSEEEKVNDFLDRYMENMKTKGLSRGFEKEYLLFSAEARLRIIEAFMEKIGKEGNTNHIFAALLMYAREEGNESQIFPTIKEKYKSMFGRYNSI